MLMRVDAQEDLLASEIDADIDAESFMEDVEIVMFSRFVKTSTEYRMQTYANDVSHPLCIFRVDVSSP